MKFDCHSNGIDSLRSTYNNQTGDEQLKTLNRLSFRYAFNNFDSAIHYVELAIKISNEAKKDSLFTEANNIKGIIYDVAGNTDSSEFYFLKTYALAIEHDFKTYEAFSINNLGMMYKRRSEFEKALDYFFKALSFNEKHNLTDGFGKNYNNIGLIYQEMKQVEKAIEYHRKAVEQRKKLGQKSELDDSYNNLGICFKEKSKVDSAIYYYELALNHATEQNNLRSQSKVNANLGVLYFEMEQYSMAEKYMLEAKKGSVIDPHEGVFANINLSGIYFALGQYKKGAELGLLALNEIEKKDLVSSGIDVYKYLSLNYAALNNKKKSLMYMKAFEHFTDSIFSNKNAESFSRLEVEYDSEKKERLLLEEQSKSNLLAKEVAFSKLKVANRNKWVFGIGGVAFSILFLGLFLIQRNKRNAQEEKDKAIISERDKSMIAVIEAQENERKRIAKDLHDGIGQQLSGLKLAWNSLIDDFKNIDEHAQKKIISLTKVLDESASEVRSISHQMMPKSLQELGLIPAINDMLEKTFMFSDITYLFEHFNSDKRYDERIEISLYRICQELINNVIKHAHPSTANIQLIESNDFLVLIVEDDGSGFHKTSEHTGHGLMNIASRLNTVNGSVTYVPSPNSGTLATIKVPL